MLLSRVSTPLPEWRAQVADVFPLLRRSLMRDTAAVEVQLGEERDAPPSRHPKGVGRIEDGGLQLRVRSLENPDLVRLIPLKTSTERSEPRDPYTPKTRILLPLDEHASVRLIAAAASAHEPLDMRLVLTLQAPEAPTGPGGSGIKPDADQ